MKPILRPTTRDDVIAYKGEPYKESFRGITIELDGRIIGIAGVIHTKHLQAFSDFADEVKQYPRTLVKGIPQFREILKDYTGSVYALASDKEDTADSFLRHVGFEHYNERLYRWHQQSHT